MTLKFRPEGFTGLGFSSSAIFALLGFIALWISRDQSMSWATSIRFAAIGGFLPSVVTLVWGTFLRRRYLRLWAKRGAMLQILNLDRD